MDRKNQERMSVMYKVRVCFLLLVSSAKSALEFFLNVSDTLSCLQKGADDRVGSRVGSIPALGSIVGKSLTPADVPALGSDVGKSVGSSVEVPAEGSIVSIVGEIVGISVFAVGSMVGGLVGYSVIPIPLLSIVGAVVESSMVGAAVYSSTTSFMTDLHPSY